MLQLLLTRFDGAGALRARRVAVATACLRVAQQGSLLHLVQLLQAVIKTTETISLPAQIRSVTW